METSGYSWFHRQGRWTRRSDTDEFRLALLSLLAEPPEARMQSYQLKKRLEERSGGMYRQVRPQSTRFCRSWRTRP
jgi:hypothetical protein